MSTVAQTKTESTELLQLVSFKIANEEFGVDIRYIKGVSNIVADVLSRYPTTNNPSTPKPSVKSALPASTRASASSPPLKAPQFVHRMSRGEAPSVKF